MDSPAVDPNPNGQCMCGCGEATKVILKNDAHRGRVKGHHLRYVHGHATRFKPTNHREQDCGYDTPCWVWQGKTDKLGYARLGASKLAHRRYYEMLVGAIPTGLSLDHLCRNPTCVNPSHLEPVTHRENIRRGAGTKLGWEQVDAIRELATDVRVVDIAKLFDVHPATIQDIVKGRHWVRR